MKEQAIIDLLYRIADDQLIIGHRMSEWTGLGPILEEDIAFSSMAQDKIGHSLAFYQLLNDAGEKDPDTLAFLRSTKEFKNSQFTELPNEDYAFTTIRHFLFDHAEWLRMDMLSSSSVEEIAFRARKIKGELTYHTMHANNWIKKLAKGNEESHGRIQQALDIAFPYALGIFEPSNLEHVLIEEDFFGGEKELENRWKDKVVDFLVKADLTIGEDLWNPKFGGRKGIHTEFLQPMLDEMSEVIRIDPEAEW